VNCLGVFTKDCVTESHHMAFSDLNSDRAKALVLRNFWRHH
jgi:hypothetical protein